MYVVAVMTLTFSELTSLCITPLCAIKINGCYKKVESQESHLSVKDKIEKKEKEAEHEIHF